MLIEDDSVDRLEGMLGDLHTTAEQARDDGENQNGDTEPHHQESFLKIVMREAKRQLYHQIFKILFYGTASSYEITI